MDSRTIEFIKTNIYYNFIIPAEDKDKVKSTLDRIFQTNSNIMDFISKGTTKSVYQYNANHVFKIVLCDITGLNRMIREPLHMMKLSYTNKPINVVIYTNKNIVHNTCPMINTSHVDFNNSALITWYEEKAEYTDVTKFPEEIKPLGIKFSKDTTPLLTELGFVDLGNVNIGFFSTFPHLRWIDIQPRIDTTEACMIINK